jgi:flagellar hook-length control protein FliK
MALLAQMTRGSNAADEGMLVAGPAAKDAPDGADLGADLCVMRPEPVIERPETRADEAAGADSCAQEPAACAAPIRSEIALVAPLVCPLPQTTPTPAREAPGECAEVPAALRQPRIVLSVPARQEASRPAGAHEARAEPQAAAIALPDRVPLDGGHSNGLAASHPRHVRAAAPDTPAADATPSLAAMAQRHEARNEPVVATPAMQHPLGTQEWREELAARLNWMIDRGEQVASLRVRPEELGPIEVRVTVRDREATIVFGAASAETRAALEQSIPRLREMLAGSGVALTDAGVFSDTPRNQAGADAAARRGTDAADHTHESASPTVVRARGLVDLYA